MKTRYLTHQELMDMAQALLRNDRLNDLERAMVQSLVDARTLTLSDKKFITNLNSKYHDR